MQEKLQAVIARLNDVLDYVEQLQKENASLRDESTSLQKQLQSMRGDLDRLKLENADRAEVIKSRLGGVLARLDELEGIGL